MVIQLFLRYRRPDIRSAHEKAFYQLTTSNGEFKWRKPRKKGHQGFQNQTFFNQAPTRRSTRIRRLEYSHRMDTLAILCWNTTPRSCSKSKKYGSYQISSVISMQTILLIYEKTCKTHAPRLTFSGMERTRFSGYQETKLTTRNRISLTAKVQLCDFSKRSCHRTGC